MVEATSGLRALLTQGDPLYTLAIIQMSNVIGGRGTHYEHRGLESKVELVAGLLLTQQRPTEAGPVSDKAMQAIHDKLDRLVELSLLRNLTAPRDEDLVVAELRFTSAMNWMTLRGTSYAHHGTDFATALYRPFDRWCLERYGFTIDDVLHVGDAAQALLTGRMNSLLREAREFAEQVKAHATRTVWRGSLPRNPGMVLRARSSVSTNNRGFRRAAPVHLELWRYRWRSLSNASPDSTCTKPA